MVSSLCILLFTLSATLKLAHLQFPDRTPQFGYDCSPLTTAVLGRSDIQSSEGLVANSLTTGDDTSTISVQILEVNIVCEASGASRDTRSSSSFVVRFTCSGGAVCDPAENFEQFQYDCLGANTLIFTPAKIRGFPIRTPNPLATLETTGTNLCGGCAEDPINSVTPSNVTHCLACLDECVGLRKCFGVLPGQCCNYFENDLCVVNCTSPLIPDDGFDCGCGNLVVANADVSFSDGFLIGSVATQSCDAATGFVSSGAMSEVTRTCTMGGWDGEDIVCQRFKCPSSELITSNAGSFTAEPEGPPYYFGAVATFACNPGYELVGVETRMCELTGWTGENSPTCRALCPEAELMPVENGMVDIVPSSANGSASIGAVGTFTCDEDFMLQGDSPRECTVDGWSGAMNPSCGGAGASSASSCGVGCIVGIVLAVLGVIILAAILAGVAYAVYSYLNHPDTKLAKYDADKINGVAKDNPLYVDPEAVVGDGAEAA